MKNTVNLFLLFTMILFLIQFFFVKEKFMDFSIFGFRPLPEIYYEERCQILKDHLIDTGNTINTLEDKEKCNMFKAFCGVDNIMPHEIYSKRSEIYNKCSPKLKEDKDIDPYAKSLYNESRNGRKLLREWVYKDKFNSLIE